MYPEPQEAGCGLDTLDAWVPGCSPTQPCPVVTAECPRPSLYSCRVELVFDEPALQCALESLRDGTPGRLQISQLGVGFDFSPGANTFVHVLDDRRAVQVSCDSLDAQGPVFYTPAAHVLAEPDYFTACLAEATAGQRYHCMMTGFGEGSQFPACAG
jgi:hypothetical protein